MLVPTSLSPSPPLHQVLQSHPNFCFPPQKQTATVPPPSNPPPNTPSLAAITHSYWSSVANQRNNSFYIRHFALSDITAGGVKKQHVETNPIPDGDHHPLQSIPSNRCKLTANGTIWPKSFSRCVSSLQRWNHTIIPTGCPLTGHRAGTLFRASQFLSEELPIRLAHRVKELNQLPDSLSDMPSIRRVANWYMQSFEVGDLPIL